LHIKLESENLNGSGNLGNLGVDGRILLKRNLKNHGPRAAIDDRISITGEKTTSWAQVFVGH